MAPECIGSLLRASGIEEGVAFGQVHVCLWKTEKETQGFVVGYGQLSYRFLPPFVCFRMNSILTIRSDMSKIRLQ